VTEQTAVPRVASKCDACGVTDDLPRDHSVSVGGGEQRSLHFRCCADEGCRTCAAIVASASAGGAS
jgi:hypothetical protein